MATKSKSAALCTLLQQALAESKGVILKHFLKFILWIIIICALIYGGMTAYHKIEHYIYPTDYADLVEKYSSEYELDKSLVFAVIKCESNFNPNAVSSIGAKGLMQLTDETYEWVCSRYGEKNTDNDNLYNPDKNIEAGCRLLKLLDKDFVSLKTRICAYHAGRNITLNWLKNPEYSSDGETLTRIPYSDTSSYVDKVVKTIEKYKKIYEIQ